MQRISTTVVAFIGGDDSTLDRLGQRANIAVYKPEPSPEALARATAAWDLARRTHATYFVHDADPLLSVADAWTRYFDGPGPVGELEVAVSETVARWRAGSLDMPDYYLLRNPEDWPPTRKHWYLGFLAGACPLRVVSAAAESDLASTVSTLPAGRWWPALDRLLTGIERLVPDRAGLQVQPEP